jgi:hypothetical protein
VAGERLTHHKDFTDRIAGCRQIVVILDNAGNGEPAARAPSAARKDERHG